MQSIVPTTVPDTLPQHASTASTPKPNRPAVPVTVVKLWSDNHCSARCSANSQFSQCRPMSTNQPLRICMEWYKIGQTQRCELLFCTLQKQKPVLRPKLAFHFAAFPNKGSTKGWCKLMIRLRAFSFLNLHLCATIHQAFISQFDMPHNSYRAVKLRTRFD